MNLLQGDPAQLIPQDIPLSCNVCPRRPDFSDISHLLTHIQSKGHLAAYYKLQVQAGTDAEAQDTVDTYEQWYADYGLEDLMRERMSQKDKKKARVGSTSRRSTRECGTFFAFAAFLADHHAAANTNSTRNTPVPRSSRNVRRPSGRSLLDPQLNRRGPASTSHSATPLSYFDPANFHRALAPTQASWGHGSYLSNSPSTVKQESVSSFEDDDDDDTFLSAPRRVLRRRVNNSVTILPVFDEASEYGGEDVELENDNAKLKGIFWKGMGLFDSATPDMKRRRNQKKEAWVLQALKDTSQNVYPTECIYDSAGALRKTRIIDGLPPSDDSLIEGESEPEPDQQDKKRPRRKARQPLIKKEPNTGRVTRSSQITAPLYTRTNRGLYYEGPEDEDDNLTYQARPNKRRTGLSIHRDNTGPEITFSQPASMTYLTSGYNSARGNVQNPIPMFESSLPQRLPAGQPSWSQNAPFRPSSHGGHQHAYPTFNSMFPATNHGGNHAFGTYGQNFGTGAATMPYNSSSIFPASTGVDLTWGMFDNLPETLPDQVDSVIGDADLGFNMGGKSTEHSQSIAPVSY